MINDETHVYVVDDDDGFRRSLTFMLKASNLNVQAFDAAVGFLEVANDLPLGCVVTDVRMPGLNGIELVRRLKQRGLAHAVIVVTGHGDIPMAVEALKAGADDFLEKPFSNAVLLDAISAALERASQTATEAAQAVARATIEGLSAREQQVLEAVLAGKANKVIALELGISPRTVEVHRARVMSKSGAASLPELVRLTMRASEEP